MNVSDLSVENFAKQLGTTGIYLRTGPFITHLISKIPSIIDNLFKLYSNNELCVDHAFADFHVRLSAPHTVRRWVRPKVIFNFDDQTPFKPLPYSQAFPMLEWGLNWCISNHSHQYLILHAAVVEKNGYAAILPAPPGSGKSTLCAGLVNSGWRLLSDELGLVCLETVKMVSLARPVNLKNTSIGVIREFAPDAVFSPEFADTNKGTVALMKAPTRSIENCYKDVEPAWIISPEYNPSSAAVLRKESKAEMFMRVSENAFNYSLLGLQGFEVQASLVDKCECYSFTYSDLGEAISIFDELARDK